MEATPNAKSRTMEELLGGNRQRSAIIRLSAKEYTAVHEIKKTKSTSKGSKTAKKVGRR